MKISNLLISQPQPKEGDKSPYFDLAHKLNLKIDFRQFIKVQGVDLKEFRNMHVDILAHTAVIFTSKTGIDSFFNLSKELKITIPETMKYFCTTEAIALYLQKYIIYRKRKIFHGVSKFGELADTLKKNASEKFLLTMSDISNDEIPNILDSFKIDYTKVILYKTVSSDLTDIKDHFDKYQMLVFFSPAGIKSLGENFPDFVQDEVKIAAFGAATCDAVESAGLRLDVKAPTPESPSMTTAIEHFITAYNKKK